MGFKNCTLLNEIFDIVSRIYSLQIGHQCYLQSAPSVGINLNHDLEEGSYWSINFVLTNKSCWREKLLASKVDSLFESAHDLFSPLNTVINVRWGEAFETGKAELEEILPAKLVHFAKQYD